MFSGATFSLDSSKYDSHSTRRVLSNERHIHLHSPGSYFSACLLALIDLSQAFLVAVRRDIPQLHAEVREWKLKFKHFFGPADKEITVEFMEFVHRVRAHIGEAKLDSAPVSPPLLKTKRAVSRKEARILHGFVRPTEPWVGAYTDDSRLFEYVPEYEQRLKAQRDAATQQAQKTKVQTEIDAEIAAAKEKSRSWRQLGFEGDFALTEGLQDGLLTKEKKTKEEH